MPLSRSQRRALAMRELASRQPSRLGVQLSPVTRERERGRAQREDQQRRREDNPYKKIAEAKGQQQADDGGGIGGILGTVLGNPIAKTILKPLELLDTPRRVVISGVNELADAVNGGDASWSDFTEQASDPSFGFGDVIGDLGPSWLNRGLGLLGDIALDPTTYVTLGTAKFAGSAGRAALAGEAAAKGLGEEAISRVGRLGANAARGAEREALGLGEAGLRFGFPSKNVRIPGTGRLAEGISRGLGAARGVGADTGVARAARRLGGSRDPALREFVERLATGKGPMSATEAAGGYRAVNAQAGATGKYLGRMQREVRQTGRELAGQGHLTRLAETPGAKLPEDAARLQRAYKRMFDEASAVVPGLRERQNYVPHIQTPEFQQWLGNSPEGQAFLQTPEASGRLAARVFGPGETVNVGGKELKFTTGTIDDIEAQFHKNFPDLQGVKLYEDDPAVLLAVATENLADDVGKAARLGALQETGLLTDNTDLRAVNFDAPDMPAQRELAEQVRAGAQPLRAQRKLLKREVNRRGEQALDVVRKPALADLEAATKLRTNARGNLGGAFAMEAGSQADRGAIDAGLAAQMTAGRGQLDRLDAELARIDEQIARYGALAESDDAAALGLRIATERRAELERAIAAGKSAPAQRGRITRQLNEPAEAPARTFVAGPGGVAAPATTDTAGTARRRAAERYERLGATAAAGRTAAEQLPATTPENVTSWLRRPDQRRLEAATVAREQTSTQRGLVEERMRNIPAEARTQIEAWEATKRIIAGQESASAEALGKADDAVEQAKARVARSSMPPKVKKNTVDEYDRFTEDIAQAIGNNAPPEAVRLLEQARALMPELQNVNAKLVTSERLANDLRSGKLVKIARASMNDGWQAFSSKILGREDLAIRQQVATAMANVDNLLTKKPTLAAKAIDNYTQLFKAYATATPGFHIRNALSATFMNASDGVAVKHMIGGTSIWKAWVQNQGREGWLNQVPERYRAVANDVIDAVYGSGAGGQFSAQEVGALAHRRGRAKNALLNNLALRGSKWSGEQVEGAVRAGMALDTMMGSGAGRAGSVAEATTRINRIHFNYSQVSEFDQQMRRLIPFWTFMSRNIPLQVTQMWTNPRTYLHYQSLQRNLESDQGSADIPQYMRDAGAFRIGGAEGWALMPDIGSNQLENQIEQATSGRILGNLTPALSVPLSLATNRDFFYDSEYKENDFQKPGWEMAPLMPVLQALGMTETTPRGDVVMERKHMDAVRDLIPFLGTVNRTAATTKDREGKELSSIASLLGIPVRQLTPEVLKGERRRRRGERFYGNQEDQARREALAQFRG